MKLNYLKSKWVAMITILFLACSVQAQNKIFVDVNATLGSNTGTSWTDAFTDLQVAINSASAGDSVFVAKGEYLAPFSTPFEMKEGVKIYGSFQGTETFLTDRVFGTNIGDTSVLKGNGSSDLVYSYQLTGASILDGFKITGSGHDGIENEESSPMLSNLTIIANDYGMYNYISSSPVLTNVIISGNMYDGILNDDNSSPILENVTISGNGDNGIYNYNSSPILTNVIISGNEENGITNFDSYPTLKNVTITGNLLSGISNEYGSIVTIDNSIVLGNTDGILNDVTSSTTNQYSLVQGLIDNADGNIDATGILPAAVFVNPVAPGNSTGGDYSLKTCAITVDAGSNALSSATTDLAGNARIYNTTIDMGAYELIYTLLTSTIDTVHCGDLTINGQTYNTSGSYTQPYTAVNGCDSVVTLNLTINNNGSNTILSACDSLIWNGTKYTVSGLYTFTTTNVAGCDSIATLDLTITTPTTSTTNYTECTSAYTWNGNTYAVAGTYIFLTTNAAGCDSTATLNLTFGTPTTSTTTKSACNSFLWNGVNRTATGTYTFNTTNATGCDSTATLVLTIGNTLTASVNIVNQNKLEAVSSGSNLTYRWIDCDLDAYIAGATNSTLDVTRNGRYAVEVTDGICKTKSACVNMTQAGVNENEALNLGVTVYPNPTSGIVTIKIANNQQADIHVYDASGKLIKTYLNLNSDDTISIEEFTTGVYTLQIQTQAGIKMERLMKN